MCVCAQFNVASCQKNHSILKTHVIQIAWRSVFVLHHSLTSDHHCSKFGMERSFCQFVCPTYTHTNVVYSSEDEQNQGETSESSTSLMHFVSRKLRSLLGNYDQFPVSTNALRVFLRQFLGVSVCVLICFFFPPLLMIRILKNTVIPLSLSLCQNIVINCQTLSFQSILSHFPRTIYSLM